MKAITSRKYGSADVLKLEEVDKPEPKEGEVLIRVSAAAVNAGDYHVMRGDPYLIRIMGYGLRRPKHLIPGQDVAGVVEAVGADVTRLRVGDEVFGYCQGAFAEHVCVPETQLRPRPAHLTLEQAATLPVAGLTALHALRDKGEVKPGQKVLVIGASGGVGTFTVQLAKAYGAEVGAVCSTRNVENARSLGADHVIDYTTEDFAAGDTRYDVIVRIAGDRTVGQCRSVLTPRGTLVIVGGGSYGRWLGGMERFLGTALLNVFTRQRLRPFVSMCNGEDLRSLAEFVAEHAIEPLLDRRYPLAQTAEAIRYVEEGHAQGKVVITL